MQQDLCNKIITYNHDYIQTPRNPVAPVYDIPLYLTEPEYANIMESDWCRITDEKRDWYKSVFQLYWDTGMRLSEPFHGVVNGNILEIPKDKSKNRRSRMISVTNKQIQIILNLKNLWNENNKSQYHIKGYSKIFKKAVNHCQINNIKHFHCMRHSYALRRRIETNGNYQKVQKELGHSSVLMTEKYQKCDDMMLVRDFPSYTEILKALDRRI